MDFAARSGGDAALHAALDTKEPDVLTEPRRGAAEGHPCTTRRNGEVMVVAGAGQGGELMPVPAEHHQSLRVIGSLEHQCSSAQRAGERRGTGVQEISDLLGDNEGRSTEGSPSPVKPLCEQRSFPCEEQEVGLSELD